MKIILIAAIGKNLELGVENKLLWKRLSADMEHFKNTTEGSCVIMGRNTWESIPKKFRPLEGRQNIVITRNDEYETEGAIIQHSLNASINAAEDLGFNEVYIIGGATLYESALDIADSMILTHVDGEFKNADVFFPKFSYEDWVIDKVFEFEKNNSNEYSFTIYEYNRI